MDMWNAPVVTAVKTAFDIQVDGKLGCGKPKMTDTADREGLQRVEALCF